MGHVLCRRQPVRGVFLGASGTPDAVSGRLLAIEDGRLVSYLGGWVNYRRRDAPETKPPPAPRAKTRGRQQQRQQQSPLELVEREIARSEERVAELERQLAEDWTNVDLLTAHRAARDDLEALLARWESLFES